MRIPRLLDDEGVLVTVIHTATNTPFRASLFPPFLLRPAPEFYDVSIKIKLSMAFPPVCPFFS